MMLHYNVPSFGDVNGFLALLATRMGRLKKGGIPDVNKAARRVLHDWNEYVSDYQQGSFNELLQIKNISNVFICAIGVARKRVLMLRFLAHLA